MYKFKLPIGDWSGDGHGHCEWFIVDSNKPFADVEKAFKAAKRKKALKEVHPQTICSDYEETAVKPEVWAKLRALGFAPFETKEEYSDFENNKYEAYVVDASLMAILVCWYIEQGDKELKLSLMEDEEMPCLYGDRSVSDDKRNVSGSTFFGYGCVSY